MTNVRARIGIGMNMINIRISGKSHPNANKIPKTAPLAPIHFTKDAMGKNVAETEVLLLPILKKAKERYVDLADTLFVLRTNIATLNGAIKVQCQEEYEKWLPIYKRKMD